MEKFNLVVKFKTQLARASRMASAPNKHQQWAIRCNCSFSQDASALKLLIFNY